LKTFFCPSLLIQLLTTRNSLETFSDQNVYHFFFFFYFTLFFFFFFKCISKHLPIYIYLFIHFIAGRKRNEYRRNVSGRVRYFVCNSKRARGQQAATQCRFVGALFSLLPLFSVTCKLFRMINNNERYWNVFLRPSVPLLPVVQHVILTTQILSQYGFIFVLCSFPFNTNTVRDDTKNNKIVGSLGIMNSCTCITTSYVWATCAHKSVRPRETVGVTYNCARP